MSVSEIPIGDIVVEGRFRTDLGDLTPLADSIEALGVLHPIVVAPTVDGEYRLIAGRRRMEACRLLRWETIPARLVPLSPSDWLQAEYDENEARKAFTHSERVALARALEPEFKAAAKERQSHGATAPGRNASGNLPEAKPQVMDQLAGAVGVSRPTLTKAMAVVDAADANPDLAPVVEAMDNKTISVAEAHRRVQQLAPDPDAALRQRRRDLLAAVGTVRRFTQTWDPTEAADLADDDLWLLIDHVSRNFDEWITTARNRRNSGLRLVQGAAQ